MDRQLIDQYEQGGELLRKAVAGLSPQQMTRTFPPPKIWSIHQIVIHLMDSDLIGADRIKRIAAEPVPPLLIGYNETAFMDNLFPHDQSVEDAITLFETNRRQTARILRKLPATADARHGIHNEVGKVTLVEMVDKYVHHLDLHLEFVRQKRALVL